MALPLSTTYIMLISQQWSPLKLGYMNSLELRHEFNVKNYKTITYSTLLWQSISFGIVITILI